MKIKLRDYQNKCIDGCRERFKAGDRKVACVLPTGCLTGDTLISINRASKGGKVRLDRLFNNHHGIGDPKYRQDIQTMVRSYNHHKKRVLLHAIDDVVKSGIKDVYKLTLESGKTIKATACHRFLTPSGWVALQDLNGDQIMVDNPKASSVISKSRKKRWDKQVQGLLFHPYARNLSSKGYDIKRLELYRLIYDAKVNDIPYERFLYIVRSEKDLASNLIYSDPSIYDIHHIDFDYTNNNRDNLIALTRADHKKLHNSRQYANFNQGIPSYDKVISTTHVGKEMTYDICCKKPYHNFSANGIIAHNSGKTSIFGKICSDFERQNKNKRAVIISHLGLLTSQTSKRFSEEWGLSSEVLQADRLPSIKAHTIITTMQSFRDRSKLLRWARKLSFGSPTLERLNIGLIIIDECHLVGNDSYKSILEMFPESFVVGFTATPFRQNKLMTDIFDSVAYTISMQELIEMGFLVKPELNLTPYDTDDVGDIAAKVVQIYEAKHKGQKAVVYMKTIEDSEMLRNILIDCGIKSSSVTSKLTGSARDNILQEFKDGNGADILTTVDVLTAGFDSPNLMAIFMPYKVGSVTTYLQRVGRGLRPYKGKTKCDIYVGSDSPGIEKGFWEKITKQILTSGVRDHDNYLDMLEYGANDFSAEEIAWTKEVVAMAKRSKLKGMDHLFDMIIRKSFPEEMLNLMIEQEPCMTGLKSKSKATAGQVEYLKGIGLYVDGITKGEASSILWNHKRSKGWNPPEDEMVKSGRHAGKHYSQVPPMYWRAISKYSNDIYTDYKIYKAKIARKINENK